MFDWLKVMFGVTKAPVYHADHDESDLDVELSDAEWEWHDSDLHHHQFCEICTGSYGN